jgi:hypothetical protein
MRFNASKCYVLSVNSKVPYFYELNNNILQQVTSNPYLGINISEDLKWSNQINKTATKANSTLAFLKRNLRHCPEQCKKLAYLALVRSILEYASVVWDPYLIKDIEQLEKVQRRAARFITGDYKTREEGCVTNMISRLELKPLVVRRREARLNIMFKTTKGLLPSMPPNTFFNHQPRQKRKIKPKSYSDHVTTNIVNRYATNNTRGYIVPEATTEQLRNSFFVKTVVEWNQLDERIVTQETPEGFKRALLQHMQ